MESSDSSLSSDWDVVNQKDLPQDILEESSLEVNVNNGMDDVKDFRMDDVKECPSTGSGVHVLTEENINHHDDILSEKNVNHHNEILSETVMNHHNDSNSSSDIDVIEEGDEDMHHSGMLLSPINFLSTTLAESGPLVPAIAPASAPNTGDGWNGYLWTHRLLRNPQFKDCLIVIFISIAVASSIHLHGTPADKIKQMKEEVDELKKENTDLKDRVISKIEDDKLFLTLEEQINTLKTENLKLSRSLESLILRIDRDEQIENFLKDHKLRENDDHKIAIDKLKEQVNLLKIDNDDLQKQLVRIRYGAFSPYSDDAKDDSGKKEVKPDQKKDAHENSSDILTKEIENLKKKLYSEVNDLKDWKKSIDNLIKQLNEKEKKDHENKDNFNNKNTDDGKSRKHTKEETHEKKKKEKFYDWSWKDFKKNFDSINVSDMLSKYVNVDEKKVKEALETMSNYFKKAQEKTKNMFKHYKEKGKNEAWDILSTLQNKWATMKHDLYENQHKKGPQPPEHESRNFAPDFTEKKTKFESEKSRRWKEENSDQYAEFIRQGKEFQLEKIHSFLEKMMLERRKKEEHLGNLALEKDEIEKLFGEHGNEPENSWLFSRAATRSILREMGEEEEHSTNWFLRRKKTTREEGSGLQKDKDDLMN